MDSFKGKTRDLLDRTQIRAILYAHQYSYDRQLEDQKYDPSALRKLDLGKSLLTPIEFKDPKINLIINLPRLFKHINLIRVEDTTPFNDAWSDDGDIDWEITFYGVRDNQIFAQKYYMRWQERLSLMNKNCIELIDTSSEVSISARDMFQLGGVDVIRELSEFILMKDLIKMI